MSEVPTVHGPVEAAALGPTYMHEHIFVLTADVQQNYPAEWGRGDRGADRHHADRQPAPRFRGNGLTGPRA